MTTATETRSADHAVHAKTYEGSCFCGAVHFIVSGEPAAMGYCHCESCRTWSAGPVNAFTLWKPEALKVTRGADSIGTYNKTPRSHRKWC
ncbi:MAG TPA: GFA family protein, partial [Burkholderiales bacterium]|nr:GFA family protein [Burkholderiales bacterium]